MIRAKTATTIRVMFTPFRDGLQSSFGGKVRLDDFLPALQASVDAGIHHFEFGGARYQAPYFYLGENPFDDMRAIRRVVGPDADLQILTRSVSGVTLTTQSLEALELQARLMKDAGTTWDRNFDFMNDVDNLVKTGQPIVDAGMHHQVCVALMGLPFESDTVHTPEFYVGIGRRVLDSDVHVDSLCLKDASGTTDPHTIYETARGLKRIMPPGMPLWMHTHDTASTAVACYMAAIDGGADGVDVSVRPLASGTVQPDGRSVAHALKGTGYHLDLDVTKLAEVERVLTDSLREYAFNPATTTADARVLGFPMPGGAIGPNVHMMAKAGILEKYGEVLEEFAVVVEAGGAWTSVTPGSQQYWLQAFNNVMYGRWEKIDPGYGRSVLGYFGRTPLPPNDDVVQAAAKQLELPVFDGDPLAAAPRNIEPARKALEERGLPVTDENVFLVLSAMVPGKKMELNEGIRLLIGNPKIDVPLKEKDAPAATVAPTAPGSAPLGTAPAPTGPVTSRCTVEENGTRRTFTVTLEPVGAGATGRKAAASAAGTDNGAAIYSTFAGSVEVVDILAGVGDHVTKGRAVAAVEAMKATHEIKAPMSGTVTAVHVKIGDEIDSTRAIMTLSEEGGVMEPALELIRQSGFANLTWGNLAMFAVSATLVFLAIRKKYEPLLLIPIGFGAAVANVPLANMGSYDEGILGLIYRTGIRTELLPPLIFLGVGVLTDFRPLLGRPLTFLLGAAAQFGIFAAALAAAYLMGFSPKEAASIGIIGGADGPTSIFITAKLAPHLLGPVAVAAYSYMSLVPIIQPPIMRMLTTKKERHIDMPQAIPVSQTTAILFPIVCGGIASLAIPSAAPLIGMLMFGNLLRECGVTERLRKTAGGTLIDIVTIFLGIAVGATMSADKFLTLDTIKILVLGAVAFSFSTAGGILFAKFLNVFLTRKINPCIGAAGVSAVPMSARVVQQFVSDETDGRVNPLMPAMGPNVAGVIGSAAAAGVFLALLS